MSKEARNLIDGLHLSGLTRHQLWSRYLALGGGGTFDDLYRHLDSPTCPHGPHEHDHNVIAQALNEALRDLGIDETAVYRELYRLDGEV